MNFFTFYTEIQELKFPFETFHFIHFIVLFLLFAIITLALRKYASLDETGQHRFQLYMAFYFFIEELLYTIWLIFQCHEGLWQELLPLQLCSICVYVSIATVFFKRTELRFFCGIVGTLAGLVAILYPANISGLYPAFSYRTINFFLLHGAFVLFGLIQLQDESLLRYGNIKRCSCLLMVMILVAFLVNLKFHTNYMFIGIPSTIGLIQMIYQMSGVVMFIPVIMILLTMLQYIVVFICRKIHCFLHHRTQIHTNSIKP